MPHEDFAGNAGTEYGALVTNFSAYCTIGVAGVAVPMRYLQMHWQTMILIEQIYLIAFICASFLAAQVALVLTAHSAAVCLHIGPGYFMRGSWLVRLKHVLFALPFTVLLLGSFIVIIAEWRA